MASIIYDIKYQIQLLASMLVDMDLWTTASPHVRVSDFGANYLRLVYDLSKKHFKATDGYLPSVVTLVEQIAKTIEGSKELSKITLFDVDHEPLEEFIRLLVDIEVDESRSKYLASTVPDFIRTVRYHKIEASITEFRDKVDQLNELDREVMSAQASKFVFVKALSEVPPEDMGSCGDRLLLGIPNVDMKLGNGIKRKEGCLFVAPTGVGKTNTLLGAMAHTARMGQHSLFIALEMSTARIQERYHGILGGIPANSFKVPRSTWQRCYRERMEYLMSPECDDIRSRGTILNLGGGSCKYTDVDEAIKLWKQSVYDNYRLDPDEVCTTVYIDWLKKMDPSGPGIRISRDAKNYDIYSQVCSELNKIWLNHDVRMIINTQATGASKGKEIITRNDIAEGKDFANQMDLVIGLAPVATPVDTGGGGLRIRTTNIGAPGTHSSGNDIDVYSGTNTDFMSECNRMLNICFMKTRDAAEEDSFVQVYQDPTLKLWNNKEDAARRRREIEANPRLSLV